MSKSIETCYEDLQQSGSGRTTERASSIERRTLVADNHVAADNRFEKGSETDANAHCWRQFSTLCQNTVASGTRFVNALNISAVARAATIELGVNSIDGRGTAVRIWVIRAAGSRKV
ncbi:hypothetical protein A5707_16435 [Mycobacterium kyorinense]|uniref:Uncharacterized protein n=1 Tax=Mycobacterium kyorinense TaxID=487514 RepID=A0A1A2ZL41_9MYCO|nr:hypothetical protein A5707_16435 [Mycobacterium kyorinense]